VIEPTVKQLANFARVRIQTETGFAPSPELVEEMFEASPTMVELWRKHHAEFQQIIDSLCEHCGGSGMVEMSDGSQAGCLRCDGTGKKL
jgi:uncharacterized pyridoxamine 5'-phosphate oxidase family protein